MTNIIQKYENLSWKLFHQIHWHLAINNFTHKIETNFLRFQIDTFVAVSDWLSLLVTSFECWCPSVMWKDTYKAAGRYWWSKWQKPLLTSYCHHQHYSSPISVNNIYVVNIVWQRANIFFYRNFFFSIHENAESSETTGDEIVYTYYIHHRRWENSINVLRYT